MSRNKGTFNFAANFEVLTKAPLDARLVVDTRADLINPIIWQDVATNVWLYDGMVVSVVQDPSAENIGLWFLLDESDYTNPDKWVQINQLGEIDASGTASVTWQINNGDNGVILKDVSGNLEVVTFDASTYANIKANHLDIESVKIDNLTGALYAQDGSVYAITGQKTLLAYEGFIVGNGISTTFPVVHDLSTLKQQVTVWEDVTNEEIKPDIFRGASTNIFEFNSPLAGGVNHTVIIMGFA